MFVVRAPKPVENLGGKYVILIALQFPHTFFFPQTKSLRATWLAVIDFQNGEQQSRPGSDKNTAKKSVTVDS